MAEPDLPDSRLRGRLTLYTQIRLALATLVLGVIVAQVASGDLIAPISSSLLAISYALLLMLAVGLLVVKDLRRFAWLHLAADTAVITAVSVQTGGVSSGYSVLYYLSVVASAYLVYQRGAMIVAAMNSVALATVAFLDGAAVLGPDPSAAVSVYTELLVRVFGLLLVAILSGRLVEQVRLTGLRLRAEEAQSRLLEQELAQVVGTIRSGLAIVAPDGRLRSANTAALRLFPDLHLRRVDEVVPGLFSEEDDVWEAAVPRGGERRDVMVTRSTTPEGATVLILEDVTSLRQMERLVLREERFAAVGHLAAAIAHEVRNPLASLSGAVQLLSVKEGEEKLHNIVKREVTRLNELVTRFLESTTTGEAERVEADLAKLVSEVVESFSNDARYSQSVDVIKELAELPPMRLDVVRLRQVLWNLLLNAAQAMPEGGTITVGAAMAGDRVRLMVQDEGVGIPEADLDRVFDPFYTTRSGGTGLGLATVERVAREHGGEVWVQSELGAGTTFVIWLPIEAHPELASAADA